MYNIYKRKYPLFGGFSTTFVQILFIISYTLIQLNLILFSACEASLHSIHCPFVFYNGPVLR